MPQDGPSTGLHYVIDGSAVYGVTDLYAQFNSLFMGTEDWELGESLDGLDDVLYRIGAQGSVESPVLVEWADSQHSRLTLGVQATEQWLEAKLASGLFNGERITQELADLRSGTGLTYFDRVVDVFAGHQSVCLNLA